MNPPPAPRPAGYSGTPLVKKLGIGPGARVLASGAPAELARLLGPLPDGARLVGPSARDVDVALVFALRAAALGPAFARAAARTTPDGSVWVAWPKKTSGVPTDLCFDTVQRTGLAAGLVDVKVCALDATWSGLKFVVRRADRPAATSARKRPARKA